jgi:SAM-dependent methyltransferase
MSSMDNGWQQSAGAWISDMGEHGDFGRRYLLDPVMLSRAVAGAPRKVLDVGCGEGRFCRMLKKEGADVVGIDPTPALIGAARARDHTGRYVQATAESLPFRDGVFDRVVSYLSLIDIPDFQTAIRQMGRVLRPGGSLLVANLNSFITACGDTGWVKDSAGERLHYPIDNYLEERAMWIEYRGIRILNHHRSLSAYLRAFIDAGLHLAYFDEPEPIAGAPVTRGLNYRRVPWFLVMEWMKPA